MTHLKCLAVAGVVLFSTGVIGQTLKNATPGQPGMFPSDVEFVPGTAPVTAKGFVKLPAAKGGLSQVSGLQLRQQETDALGITHIRYQQSYLGVQVENAYEIIHSKAGSIIRQNGKLVEDFDRQLTATPHISEASALRQALSGVGAKVYKWQIPAEEAFIKQDENSAVATFYPKGLLVFYSGEEEVIPSAMRLAYRFDVYAQQPLSRHLIFIDAQNGAILGKRDLIHETNATGTAVTAYSGNQTIIADSYNGGYRLQETGRGNGIQTYNLKKGTTYTNTDFVDADNTWNNVNTAKDQYATDAHWGAEKTYDYFKAKYNRNSIDNAGFAIKSYIHYSTNYFNAFWDGSRMTYGDGDATDNYKPLTALDVCGHEISHGLTSFTSNLNYSYESGALNEGFSDIFGTAIEFYARPSNANWLVGSDFYTIRSMSNPNAYGQPDTYQGTNWATGSADNGGVHTNSGVLNFWFYLLSVGGSGTNDKGTAYNVAAMGIDKAAAIAFRTNTVYLTSTSNYADARAKSIMAAQDLYGATSAEATQTANAWTAVGVGGTSTPACTDNYEANESMSAAKTISVNTAITAKIGVNGDKDYFKFTTTASAPKVKVTLTNLPGDYDLYLYNSAGTQIGKSEKGSTDAESITYNTSTVAATYYVYVVGYGGAFSSTSCYRLTASVSGTNFFTIDGEDNNGFIAAASTKETPAALTLQPVPANSYTTLVFGSKTSSSSSLMVTDMAGALVKKMTIPVSGGTNQYRLDVSSLKPGTYFVKMIAQNGEAQVQKLVIQH